MNERIKLLAEQAWKYANDNSRDGDETHGWLYRDKFAELIVKECVRVVDDTMTENQEMNIGLVMASAAIVSHFGVEE